MNRVARAVFYNVVQESRQNTLSKQRLQSHARIHSRGKSIVLGIETSCDDTGCAIVDSTGNILGESLHSQMKVHLDHGGIVPPVARNLHNEHIHRVVSEAVERSGVGYDNIDAIATTVKPGLPLSLVVGKNFGVKLAKEYNKPFIPIHHMEAHALMVRMTEKVDFPFVILLASGGHCLLAVARGVDDFLLLGQGIDDAPGEAFDKTARRLNLRLIPELSNVCGGRAIEIMAERGDPLAFNFTVPLFKYRDCNFSFAGMKNTAQRYIIKEERVNGLSPGQVISSVANLCASFQLVVTRHLCHRLQRAMEFIERNELVSDNKKSFVVSGGVACNTFIRKSLSYICEQYGYQMFAPPPRLCTDNGVMIAWNGVERWRANLGIAQDLDLVDIKGRSPLGKDLREDVAKASIKCRWIKLRHILEHNNQSHQITDTCNAVSL